PIATIDRGGTQTTVAKDFTNARRITLVNRAWSADVSSPDLPGVLTNAGHLNTIGQFISADLRLNITNAPSGSVDIAATANQDSEIGRASCREEGTVSVVAADNLNQSGDSAVDNHVEGQQVRQ